MIYENTKVVAKISAKIFVKWIFIFGLGNLVTFITFFIAIYSNIGMAGGGHGNIIALFLGLLLSNLFAFLLVFGAPFFLALYFMLANKISIESAIYLLWKSKMGDFISSKVGSMAKLITEKEGWNRNLSDKALLKAKVLQLIKNDKDTSKLHRKVIGYGLKKIQLDDINFEDENINLATILTTKFNNFVSQIVQPSFKLVWIIFAIQLLLLIGSFFFKIEISSIEI